MTFDPDRRVPPAPAVRRSRFDPRGGGPRRWIAHAAGVVLLALALLWLFGAFDSATDPADVPATAAGEGATVPVVPAAPQ